MKRKFIILSASTGNGHTSAANALKDEIMARGHDAKVVDCMDHVTPVFRRWFKGGYEMLVRESPWLWGHLYRTSDRPLLNYWVQTFLDWKYSWPMDDLIREYKPDWIICTHSVAQPRLPKIRKELNCPVAVIVTDLHPHRMWLRGDPDWFFVPTEESREVLERRVPGSAERSFVTGIPINQVFATVPCREVAKKSLELDDRPAILVTSGGIGAGPFEKVASLLADLPVRLLVVAGRSKEAQARLQKLFKDHPNVNVYGHVPQEKMALLMAAADILVGKSGGLTTFEALAVGCPFLVYTPFLIPGQEEDNAAFLEEIGVGMTVHDLGDLKAKVEGLLADPELLEKIKAVAKAHAKPHARTEIVDRIFQLDELPTGRVAAGV